MNKKTPTTPAGVILSLIDDYPMLTKEQEKKYAIEKNHEMLVLSTLRLAVHMAKGKMHMGVEFDDLIQIAVIGLCEATKTFDHTRNVRFSTWAFNSVRKELNRALSQISRPIRLPEWLVHVKLREERNNE